MRQADRDEFDTLLEEIIASLPSDVSTLLNEIAVIVEDEPSNEMLEDLGVDARDVDLCGLHWGIPISKRSIMDSGVLPPQILIFRGPVWRLAGTRQAELQRQIRITLLHEIGHHYGLSEARLAELGYA